MKKFTLITFFTLSLVSSVFIFVHSDDKNLVEKKFYPSDWFYNQRAYPFDKIPVEEYYAALDHKEKMPNDKNSTLLADWYAVGPSNIGGRLTALDYDPANDIIYAAAAAGGVFKSTDGGNTWLPKTDFKPSLSIGALVIDPNNPNIIYCGTGEANISTDSYAGFGMIKSTDYGETWALSGLENSRHIAEIEVHPLNSNIVYAAASGGLYSKSPDRGIYKSTDAGSTWSRSLFINDSTSAIDVAIDPDNLDIVYAAMWSRLRGPSFRRAAGINSGLYKSTDGGLTWNQMLNGLPSPSSTTGRISIAVAPGNSNYIYALYKEATSPNGSTNTFSGFYRSTDKGESWNQMPSGILPGEFSSFGWYFGVLEVDPNNENLVYCADVDLFKSTNGGESWQNITNAYSGSLDEQHPDQHALWIDPTNSDVLINGNDGGLFITSSGGAPWTKSYDLPVSQFYASEIDFLQPEIKLGGTQDNGTLRSDGSVDNWDHIYGGDGFHTKVDYTNSNIIYAESQNGGLGKSTNGGQNWNYNVTNGIDFGRTNWSTPYVIDLQDPSILYFGTYKLHRTTNGAGSWTAISGDLTHGANGYLGTITCISTAIESDNTTRVIYVGTNDAKLSVSTNSGSSWEDRSGILPQRYITDVLADRRDPSTAYVTLSGYNLDETNPHVFRTTDYGVSWNDISGNLPDVPVNSVIINYDEDSTLYVGSDVGVFFTFDLGNTWYVVGNGLPNSPVFDLNYHQPTKKLVAGTHGRSLFEIDLSGVTSVSENNSAIVDRFELYQNYPNPFNPATIIRYNLFSDTKVRLEIFGLAGETVSVLVDDFQNAGTHEINFDGSNLSSGIYFYKLNTESFSLTRKMILMK